MFSPDSTAAVVAPLHPLLSHTLAFVIGAIVAVVLLVLYGADKLDGLTSRTEADAPWPRGGGSVPPDDGPVGPTRPQ